MNEISIEKIFKKLEERFISFDSKKQFYTISEAKNILRISRTTLYRRLCSGEIPSVKIGGRVLIPASFFNQLTQLSLQQTKIRITGETNG